MTNALELMKESSDKLFKLTGKKIVYFTRRGNISIKLSLQIGRLLGKSVLFIPDQGGWLTYSQFGEKLGYKVIKINSKDGFFDVSDLSNLEMGLDGVLLLNSMPAYSFGINTKEIYDFCQKNSVLLINDSTGSLGFSNSLFGDIIVGSFGNFKPVPLGRGGFLCVSKDFLLNFSLVDKDYLGFSFKDLFLVLTKNLPSFDLDFGVLNRLLSSLDERIKSVLELRAQLIESLSGFKIINSERFGFSSGFNIIVPFESDDELERLIKIGENLGVEHTICPREIRVLRKAVCFEVKRFFVR